MSGRLVNPVFVGILLLISADARAGEFVIDGVETEKDYQGQIDSFCSKSFDPAYCKRNNLEQRSRLNMAWNSPATKPEWKQKMVSVILSHKKDQGVDWWSAAYEYFSWIKDGRIIVGGGYVAPKPSRSVSTTCETDVTGAGYGYFYRGKARTTCKTDIK